MAHLVRVWDLPTRLFHWSLVLCVIGLVFTGYRGAMDWHPRLGYAVLTLLLFRLIWGMVGGRWSRFSSFVFHPSDTIAYVRDEPHPRHRVGHNPLGALSVFAMLIVLLAQVATGLVSDDEIAFAGPLNRFVSSSVASSATWYHKVVGQRLIICLVLLHVAAIFFYLWKRRDNLIQPMLVGDKTVLHPAPHSRDDALTRIGALILFVACAMTAVWLVGLGQT